MKDFLKSRRLYMLFVLPLAVAAIAFIGQYVAGGAAHAAPVRGCIDLSFIHSLDPSWKAVIGGVALLGVTFLIFFIHQKFKLLYQRTTLPSVIYVLLTSGIMARLGFDYLLIAALIVAVAVERLLTAIYDPQRNSPLFDFGALIMLSVAIYPKFILLAVWAVCVLFFSGRSTFKDMVALLVGLLTPVVFIVFAYFWMDRLPELPEIFLGNLLSGEYLHHLPVIEWVRLGILALLLLAGLVSISVKYPLLIVSHRRGMLALVWMLIFLLLMLIVVPGSYYDFMYLTALPLSFIYAHYFLTRRVVLTGNLMFLLLLCACVLTYLL